MKRLAPILFAMGCGASEAPATHSPCVSAATVDAAPPVAAASSSVPDAAAASDTPALVAAADAGTESATPPLDPQLARDLLLAQMANLPLKRIPSPPPPPHDPPPPPPTHDLEVRRASVPRMFESTLQVSEGLPFEVVRRIVRQNYGRLRLCYEVELRQNPGGKAKMAVRFIIDPHGNVALTEPAPSDAPPPLLVCYIRAFRSLSFPAPSTPMLIEYGMSFEP
jgi:hypothetical protein